jgi:hypothetical protein
MPLSFSSGACKAMGLASSAFVPAAITYPMNSLIPYYGNDPALSDWDRYSVADGYYIAGTSTQASIGTKVAANGGGGYISGSLNSGGSHSGTSVVQNLYLTSGSGYKEDSAGGSHSHTVDGSGFAYPTDMLNTQNITLLKANKDTTELPINSLVIKQTAATSSTAFSTTGSNYLKAANNDQTFTASAGGINFQVAPTVSTAGYHAHSGNNRGTTVPSGQRFYAYYLGSGAGDHSGHSITATFTQSVITSKLMNLWKVTAPLIPETGIIVMYVGTLSLLPSSWKLCDGNNSTPNLGGYVLGYSDGQWDIATVANPYWSIGSVGSAYLSHAHNGGGYSGANLAQGSYANINTAGQHGTYGWSHTHTNGVYGSSYSYLPPRINVAFIQYKG